jgi:hypothetical protein
MASAVVNALRQVGRAFGVAVLGALVYAHLPGDAAAGRLDPAHASPCVDGLHDALWVSGWRCSPASRWPRLLLTPGARRAAG